jgi:large subunit ribosomal protein L16
MGSGKGSFSYWAAIVKPGTILFEITGISNEMALEALKNASYKLPIKTKLVIKNIKNE